MQPFDWSAHYDPGVPRTLAPYPQQTLLDIFHATTLERPGHPFVRFQGASQTYAQVDAQSDAFAAALETMGISPGDRIALLLPNCPQAIACQFGAWKAGVIVCPLNPRYTAVELTHALATTGATVAVVLSPFYAKLKRVQPDTMLEHVIVAYIKTALPFWKRLGFTMLREGRDGHRVRRTAGDRRLSTWLRRHHGRGRRIRHSQAIWRC